MTTPRLLSSRALLSTRIVEAVQTAFDALFDLMPSQPLRAILKTTGKCLFERDRNSRGEIVTTRHTGNPSTSAAFPKTSEGANLPTMTGPVNSSNELVAGTASPTDEILTSDTTNIMVSQENESAFPMRGSNRSHQLTEFGLSHPSRKDTDLQNESVNCFDEALKLLEPEDLLLWKDMQSSKPPAGEANNMDELERSVENKRMTIPGVNTQKLEDSQNPKLVVKKLESFLKIAKPLVMNLSRIDPHGLAPYISAGVFFAAELLLGLNTTSLDMIAVVLSIESQCAIVMRKWMQNEKYIMYNHQAIVSTDQEELRIQVTQLYAKVITLITSVYMYMKASALKKALNPKFHIQIDEWRSQLSRLTRAEVNCESIRFKIEKALKNQEENLTVLDWVTKHSPVDNHVQIRESAHLHDTYQSAGAWLFEESNFRKWKAANFSVLWVRGTMGTGKTTLICSTINRLLEKHQEPLGFSSEPRVIFYYYCSRQGKDYSEPTYENIIRALVKQYATRLDFSAAPSVRSLWERNKVESLKITIGKWETVLKELIQGSVGSVLVIDALDECEKSDLMQLLKFFKDLEAMNPAFRLILSSQEHVNVNLYFKPETLLLTEMTSGASKEDMATFIEEQINMAEDLDLNPEFKNSIMYENDLLVKRVKKALHSRANGMFQWVKIYIALFYPLTPICIEEDAERLLAKLDKPRATMAMPQILVEPYSLLLMNNTPAANHLSERMYMLRAYRLLLCCYGPWNCDTLCQAVSIQPNGTLDESVKPDRVRSWCVNFFKISKTGVFTIAHDSARQFLQESARMDTLDGPQQDCSPASCELQMAELCLQVMSKSTHKIWEMCDFGPQTWSQSWNRVRQLGFEQVINTISDSKYWPYYPYNTNARLEGSSLSVDRDEIELIELSDRSGFAVYACLFWFPHCTKAAPNISASLSKLLTPSNLESAFSDWALLILMVKEPFERHISELIRFLKCSIIDSLKNVDSTGERFDLRPSPLIFLISSTMFDDIFPLVSLPIQENLKGDKSRQDLTGIELLVRDDDCHNLFGQTPSHIAARHRSQLTLKRLAQSKSRGNQGAKLQYLSIRDKSGRTALHCSVDQDSYLSSGGKDPASVIQYILSSLGGMSDPLRAQLLGVKDNSGFSALDYLVEDFDLQRVLCNDVWKSTGFSTVYDALVTGSPPLHDPSKLLKTLLTRSDQEASWAKALYISDFSKNSRFDQYLEQALSSPDILLDISIGSDSVITSIIKRDPNFLRQVRPLLSQLPLRLAAFSKKELDVLMFLLEGAKDHLGRCKHLSTWYRDFAAEGDTGFRSLDVPSRMLDLEPDFRTIDETPLQFFGHDWSHCTSHSKASGRRRFLCPFIFSSDFLKLLIVKHGKLFSPHADGTIPFLTILERVSSHIGFMAFLLWNKPSPEIRMFPELEGSTSRKFSRASDNRLHQYWNKMKEPTLLKFLRTYCYNCHAKNVRVGEYPPQEVTGTTGTTSEEEGALVVEECLPSEQYERYNQELVLVQRKWIEVQKIARKSWDDGKWREGDWQVGSEWIVSIAGKKEFLAMWQSAELKKAGK